MRCAAFIFLSLTFLPGVLSSAAAQGGGCPGGGFAAVLLTEYAHPLPPTARLLIGLDERLGSPLPADRFPRIRARLRQGRRTIALRFELIAPGLARLSPARRPSGGRWTLEGLDTPLDLTFRGTDSPQGGRSPHEPPSTNTGESPVPHDPNAPPEVNAARSPSQDFAHRVFGTMWAGETLMARLDAPSPANAVGVIVIAHSVYRQRPNGERYRVSANEASIEDGTAHQEPVLFRRIQESSTRITLYTRPSRCALRIPNARAPASGATIRLAWVDRWGGVSEPSDPFQVQ